MLSFSDALLSVVKQQVIKAIISKVPFLGAPLLNPLLALAVNNILKIAFSEAAMQAYFIKIQMLSEHQANLVKESQAKLDSAKTENEKIEAEYELKKHLKDLITFKP